MQSEYITYKDLRDYAVRARNPRVGRNMDANTKIRIRDKQTDDEHIELYNKYNHKIYAWFYPNDTVTMVCDVNAVDRKVFRYSHPIPALAKNAERRSSLRLVLDGSVEYFPGLRIDMKSGEYLNQKPPLRERIRKAENAVWRQKSAAFRRAVKLRGKMGVISTIWSNIEAVRAKHVRAFDPIHTSKDDVAVLYRVMNEDNLSTEALQYFCLRFKYERYWVYDRTDVADMLPAYVDTLINRYRDELRSLFGVYEDV